MNMVFGIIGFPLAHSFSPDYFNKKFKEEKRPAVYRKFELKRIEEFPQILKGQPDLRGLNVTAPYKKSIIPYLDETEEAAKKINAVNCIRIESGKLYGYNTDISGFEKSLAPLLTPDHKKALILGTGGSAQAVKYVLEKLHIAYLSVSRKPATDTVTYQNLTPEIIQESLLIINTTPLGMHPDVQALPDIPYQALSRRHLLFDLIYNPEETRFLKSGKQQGAIIKNGLEMLYVQAEESWKIWTGFQISPEPNPGFY